MEELHLQGYITINNDGIVSLIGKWPEKVQYLRIDMAEP